MTVYIEYVIVDNMVFDCLILWAAAKTLKSRVKIWRVLLGGIVGTSCAILSMYVSGTLNILLKICCLFAMCLCMCGFKRKLFWYILLTTAYTFVVGGAVVGLFFLTGVEFSLDSTLNYQNSIPLGIYALAIALSAFLVYSIVLYIAARKKTFQHTIDVVLHLSKDFYLTGFCDSGNSLQVEGMAVCFAVGNFKKAFSRYIAQAVLQKTLRTITYLTMAGQTTALATACKLTVGQTTHEILLALPKLSADTNYDILLHCSLIPQSNSA